MSHVFISYSTVDTKYADGLREKLIAEGFDVWIANRSLRSGDWWKSIVYAIWNCAVFVPILTSVSDQSEWVQREITIAVNRKKAIFPTLLEGDIETPNWQLFVRTQYADVRDGTLPPAWFYEEIAKHLPRKYGAKDVTTQPQSVINSDTTQIKNIIATPPSRDDEKINRRLQVVLALAAAVVAIIAAVITIIPAILNTLTPATQVANPPTSTPTATVSDTPTIPVTVTSTSVPSPTPIPTNAPSALEAAINRAYAFTGTKNSDWQPYEMQLDDVPMVLVPTGCLTMGNNEGRTDETPEHVQCFDAPFWIDKYEVTNSQFNGLNGMSERRSNWPQANLPRENITWFEARDFCELRGARLPTEREWEYAARGIEGWNYPWGQEFDASYATFSENAENETDVVGRRQDGVSWVNALDMSGNVAEWVSSLYQPYAYTLSHESDTDTTYFRVIRGGSWRNNLNELRTTSRDRVLPNEVLNYVGFRCARDVEDGSN